MSETTGIEWTDRTWSPWEGCQKVGPGCDHCYAEARNARFSRGANWGPGAPRRLTADWRKPERWNAELEQQNRQETVFPSLCDPFDNAVAPQWRAEMWSLIDRTPFLMWLLLTKRIGNVAGMLPPWHRLPLSKEQMVPANVAIGATMVNQEEVDRDWHKLAAVPTRRLFVSIEPMLDRIVLPAGLLALRPWVIVGGESGRYGRMIDPWGVLSLRDQCASAGVPFLFKQWGEWAPITGTDLRQGDVIVRRDSDFVTNGITMRRVGKKAAGRALDGRTHDEFPTWIRR